ncbi:D-alanyl-D-alanine carboxypeptidase family protein [Patescibacteria group bacterium]|nr:MAG: D-alanyl-D-alanine carboxypeptidase family protein [Patescibacteria group bacterium]
MAHNLKRFIEKHLHLLGIVIALLVITAVYITSYIIYQNQAISATDQATQANEKSTEALLAKIKQEKATAAAAAQKKTTQATVASTTPAPTQSVATSCNTSTSHNDPSAIDVLVNKKHCIVPLSFYPSDLVNIDGATLSAKAADSFDQMFMAATAAGQPFGVSSSYRSYTTQVTTYNYWISVSGQAGADTYSARPGYSEHQTGLAVDVKAGSCTLSCFISTTQYNWLQTHAADYGFIQRYPDGKQSITGYETEEWHYRYVGAAVAQDMKMRGISTLEEYWGLSGGDY